MSKDPVAVFEDLLTRPPGFRNSHYWKASRDFYGHDQTVEQVRSTLNPELQRAAEAALQEGLFRYERSAGRLRFAAAGPFQIRGGGGAF